MLILIDSHEKKPWQFGVGIKTKKMHQATGDYTLAGYKSKVTIERKSVEDLCCSLSDRDLQRYCSQLARLRKFPFRAVFVEGKISDLLAGRYRASLPPNKMLARMMDTCLRFRIPIFFCENEKVAATTAVQFFRSAATQIDASED